MCNFKYLIDHEHNLSPTAYKILKKNVFSLNEFFKLTKKDFLNFKQCSVKTANKLIDFQKGLANKLGIDSREIGPKYQIPSTCIIPDSLKIDKFFYEIIMEKLSSKNYDLFVNRNNIDSLSKLISLNYDILIKIKHCNNYSINEIRQLQELICIIVSVINSQPKLLFLNFESIVKQDQLIRNLMGIGEDVDPDNLFFSLNSWILSIAKGSKFKRNKAVFMKRMGMSGYPKMTYQEIGIKHNISRERVKQITDRMKKTGLLLAYSIRLDPLIERAAEIVRSAGNQISIAELIMNLPCLGIEYRYEYAIPFVKYLSEFPLWKKLGLRIKGHMVYLNHL